MKNFIILQDSDYKNTPNKYDTLYVSRFENIIPSRLSNEQIKTADLIMYQGVAGTCNLKNRSTQTSPAAKLNLDSLITF